MRILSLLPSATEIVFALGLGDDLVAVTHECDWPPDAMCKPSVTSSALDSGSEPAEIDRLVSASVGEGEPIYRIDTEAICELRPDLVLSQDLCAVCAVPSGYVNEALDVLGCQAEVVSLDPSSLDDVLDCIMRVATATATTERARVLVSSLRKRLDTVRDAVSGSSGHRPRTFALEWSDPPFTGGHWVPDMIELAGGEPVLGSLHTPSVRVSWEQIEHADPEVVVFMPCGYDLEAAASEAERMNLASRPELRRAGNFFAVDATSYFSRPGPRLVDGVEILASALHPDAFPRHPSGGIRRIEHKPSLR
jgi:iron complex transport system substrate-binding protein